MMNAASPHPLFQQPRDLRQQMQNFADASFAWFQLHWLEIAIASAVGTAIVLALYAVRRYGQGLCRAGHSPTGWRSIIGRAITRTTDFFIIASAAKLVDGYAQAPAQITHTINFLFTIAAGFQVAIWAREIILGMIEHRARGEHYRGETIINALGIIRLLVTVALFGIAAIVILGNLGVNVTGLIAGLGVGGIAIGLAAQGIFADLFAALAIIFDRPFSKGDAISYDNTDGTVEEIGLKSTRVRSVTGEERIIANKNLLDKEIRNNTRRTRRRITFKIGVIYQTPPEVARAIPDKLREIVEAAGVEFIRSGFVNFGDSSLDFEMEMDAGASFAEAYESRHLVGIAILKRFNDEGIEFAYPTQTSFAADPQGRMIMPYPEVQSVKRVDLRESES